MAWLPKNSRQAAIIICSVCTVLVGGWHFAEHVVERLRVPWVERFRSFKPLEHLDLATQDMLVCYFGKVSPRRAELVYLAIDRDSIQLDQFAPEEVADSPALSLMKEGWPWSRAVYPLILKQLVNSGAKVVAMDLLFPTARDGDEAFRPALDTYRQQVVIGSNFVVGKFEANSMKSLQLPSDSLIPPTAPMDDRVGFVNFWPDSDEVIRRVRYRVTTSQVFGDAPEAGEEVLYSLMAVAVRKAGQGASIPPAGAQRLRFAGKAGTFTPHSVSDIFDSKNWESRYRSGEFFNGKIVLLGPEGNFMKDIVRTPFGEMPGPEMQLNAINAALNGDFISETTEAPNYLLIAVGGLLACLLCLHFPAPLYRLGWLGMVGAGWLLIAQVLYNHASFLIPIFSPLLALGSSGICCLSWDYFIEQRERVRIRSVLDRYVSKEVAELVLAESDTFETALQGQRRWVTTLFSDIRGFTTMTESSEPEKLVSQLNEYFYEMVDAVLLEEGTLQQFVGDAIMAVWGNTFTLAREVGAAHGVRTSLQMSAALAELNRQWADNPSRRQLKIGIGVHHGEVIVGSLGHPRRMEFTVIGDGINTAARLEAATKQFGCTVLVGGAVEELTRDQFLYRRVDFIKFIGKTQPVEVYTLMGELPASPPPWHHEYHYAIELYRKREFAAAHQTFRRLDEHLKGSDPLCEMYAARCERYEKAPPPDDWDGSYTLTEK